MVILKIVYILLLIITGIAGYIIVLIKSNGMNVKDFWKFLNATQELDMLYKFSKKCAKMTQQEQLVFLLEAERLFKIYDKVPKEVWEDEYHKYSYILDVYRKIKVTRWANANA